MSETNWAESKREEITKKIVEAIQVGCAPWRRPWGNTPEKSKLCIPMSMPKNFLTGNKYSGINPLLIMLSCENHGFVSPYWGTINQWSQIGGYIKPRPHHVPEGKWGTNIILYTKVEKKKEKASAIPTEENETFMLMRSYTIFNADQISPPNVEMIMESKLSVQIGLAKKVLGKKIGKMTRSIAQDIHDKMEFKLSKYKNDQKKPVEYVEANSFLSSTGARIIHGGIRACYKPQPADYIKMPPAESFDTLSDYYETAYHELCHWASVSNRAGKPAKNDTYAFNELVAEIGACFLAAETDLPIHQDMLPRSQSYLKFWLGEMENDPKFIFEASTQASKVVDYLLNLVRVKCDRIRCYLRDTY